MTSEQGDQIIGLLRDILEAERASAVQLAQCLAELARPRLEVEAINAATRESIMRDETSRRAKEAAAQNLASVRPRLFARADMGGAPAVVEELPESGPE